VQASGAQQPPRPPVGLRWRTRCGDGACRPANLAYGWSRVPRQDGYRGSMAVARSLTLPGLSQLTQAIPTQQPLPIPGRGPGGIHRLTRTPRQVGGRTLCSLQFPLTGDSQVGTPCGTAPRETSSASRLGWFNRAGWRFLPLPTSRGQEGLTSWQPSPASPFRLGSHMGASGAIATEGAPPGSIGWLQPGGTPAFRTQANYPRPIIRRWAQYPTLNQPAGRICGSLASMLPPQTKRASAAVASSNGISSSAADLLRPASASPAMQQSMAASPAARRQLRTLSQRQAANSANHQAGGCRKAGPTRRWTESASNNTAACTTPPALTAQALPSAHPFALQTQ